MNVRELLKWQGGYNEINREERNLAAIFFHVLLTGDNLSRFLNLIRCDFETIPSQTAVFFEYAYLRDLWAQPQIDNAIRRELILRCLQPGNAGELQGCTIEEFNRHFGAGPRPSAKHIQSPGTWSISRFKDTIADNEGFLNACRFKWAFNAKPDIVIHTSHDTAVCIEAKFTSGEGQYPTNRGEIEEFKRRGLTPVGQTAVQHYLMEDLLGIRTQFLFLVQKASAQSDTHTTLTWRQAFEAMETPETPAFIRDAITRV